MDIISNLAYGFSVAFSLNNLGFAFVGVLLGTLVGVLPGIGPVATISMLLPITYVLSPVTGIIMLAGIYYGAQYGGSTTAILVNLPGESSSVVTAIDGHQMAKRGEAGAALVVAALGSLFAGIVGTILIAAFGPVLAQVAFAFGAPEYFSLVVLGLLGSVVLAHGSAMKAIAMIMLGLLFGTVGTDVNSGASRFTFGSLNLIDGFDIAVVAMGVFGIAELLRNIEDPPQQNLVANKVSGLWLSAKQFKASAFAAIRGTAVGSILGLLPGGGAVLSSFASYTIEKKVARDPSRFGKGAIEGVAGPESANNAAAQTSFIPMLTLGIPATSTMALMIGAMTVHNIQPGPMIMTKQPDLFWGLIASMLIGNIILVVLNLPLVGIWVKLLKIPYRLLLPAILLFSAIGLYSLENSTFDVMAAFGFGVFGYLMTRCGCEPAPFVLGFILGPMLEENLRRALTISQGDASVFFTRPISLSLLIAAAALLALLVAPVFRNRREEIFQEAE
ncbi:tripartite tricarboxylate transporter permease [Ensifer sp. ENS05]|uniref:tripartite tricarboxylate transporter permease n=1 Tax=Ensifer sp. ENS05 TaxID=2769277 RepID=UPI0017805672|nr:tripartite tricarboxylate transporter permease [Ensifer sp. ENS05]MBD9596391.1 tripartite tricarboxylate transporter permease [Ensifer sp. ENS05]